MIKGNKARISLVNYLTKDPEVKYSGNGKAYVKLAMMADTSTYDAKTKTVEESFVWVNITMFGEYAVKGTQAMVKGCKIWLEGTLSNLYVNSAGEASMNVIATNMSIEGWPKDYVKGQGRTAQSTPAPAQEEEEIPF